MIKIAVTAAAYEAIAATLPVGSVGYEAEASAKGERHIWIDDRQVDKLDAQLPGDVILRLVRMEGACAP